MDVALGLLEFYRLSIFLFLNVLILVVMDVALGQFIRDHLDWNSHSFNPCCNGCRTWANSLQHLDEELMSLNPCCNVCRTWAQ